MTAFGNLMIKLWPVTVAVSLALALMIVAVRAPGAASVLLGPALFLAYALIEAMRATLPRGRPADRSPVQ